MADLFKKYGYAPKVVIIKGFGAFVIGASDKDLANVNALFLDACKIAVYAGNFGGSRPMTDEMIDFITNWEVESYRQKAAN